MARIVKLQAHSRRGGPANSVVTWVGPTPTAELNLCRDANGRLLFDLVQLLSAEYTAICEAVVAACPLLPSLKSFLAGPDTVATGYRQGDQVVELAWDNWSGLVFTAKSGGSESLVGQIASWLSSSDSAGTGFA